MIGTYIYVIGCHGSDHVKIGIAHNPEKRLKQLQTGSPVRLSVLRRWGPMDRARAVQLEASAHFILADFRANGEWFAATADHAGHAVWLASMSDEIDLSESREVAFDYITGQSNG